MRFFISTAFTLLCIAGCAQDSRTAHTGADEGSDTKSAQHWERSWGEQTTHTPDGEIRGENPGHVRTVAFESGTADERFLREAASGGQMQIELGHLSLQRARNARVKQFGRSMIEDHRQADRDLHDAADKRDITIPAGMMPAHQAMINRLSPLSGDKFDREYVRMMVGDHVGMVAKYDEEARNGLDPHVREFAEQTLPTLRDHLDKIRKIAHDLDIKVEDEEASVPGAAPRN